MRTLGIPNTKPCIPNLKSLAQVFFRRYWRRNGWHDLERPLNKGQGDLFLYQSISYIRPPIGYQYNFWCRTHRLATIHSVQTTDGDRRQTQHCSISATVCTVGCDHWARVFTTGLACVHVCAHNYRLAWETCRFEVHVNSWKSCTFGWCIAQVYVQIASSACLLCIATDFIFWSIGVVCLSVRPVVILLWTLIRYCIWHVCSLHWDELSIIWYERSKVKATSVNLRLWCVSDYLYKC